MDVISDIIDIEDIRDEGAVDTFPPDDLGISLTG